jgi:RNA methyltransferase, TrmH family
VPQKTIRSRDNPLYKELKKLASSSQARRRAQRTLFDGIHLCKAYLEHVGPPLMCIVGDAGAAHAEAAEILCAAETAGAKCMRFSDALFAPLGQVEHGVGILFVIDTPGAPAIEQVASAQSILLLDGLQDPGNLGSILRSAAAAGIGAVYCGPGTVFAWSPKVMRAGMGAHFLLSIVEDADLAGVIRAARVPVLATSSHATQSLYDQDLRVPVAWLFGNEGQGVSPALLSLASKTISIPQAGGIESLNVAASAAICFFEQRRQRQGLA